MPAWAHTTESTTTREKSVWVRHHTNHCQLRSLVAEPKLNLSRVRTRTRSLREGPDSSAASGRLALRDPERTGTSQSSTEGAAHIIGTHE